MTAGVRRFEHAALVINSGSRTGARAFDTARARLTELGVRLTDFYPVSDAAAVRTAR